MQLGAFLIDKRTELALDSLRHDIRRLNHPVAQMIEEQTHRQEVLDFSQRNEIDFDYRAALAFICADDKHLVDAFFDRLVRSREVAVTHQFLAILSAPLNTHLAFTTNFDDLVEGALEAEGRKCVAYELLADQSTIPHESLVKRHLSLVKLHGGKYSLSADFDLERELSDSTIRKLESYLPRKPLIVTLGYSGNDFRVMSFIRHFCTTNICSNESSTPAVLWVHREKELPSAAQNTNEYAKRYAKANGFPSKESIASVRYRDGKLFLQELHQRLSGGHAVSRTGYRALLHTPRRFDYKEAPIVTVSKNHELRLEELENNKGEMVGPLNSKSLRSIPRVTLILGENTGSGSSRALSQFVEEVEKTFQTIWIDCAEIRSRPTFIDTLLEHFRQHDRWLPPATIPPFLIDLDEINPLGIGRFQDPDDVAYCDEQTKRAINAITYAMRRGRYIIAIDSLGEFANEHPAARLEESEKCLRFRRLTSFILELTKSVTRFGDSILAIAYTRNWTVATDCADEWKAAEDELTGGIGEIQKTDKIGVFSILKLPATKEDRAPLDDPWQLLVGALASAFRRPRSIVTLRTLLADILQPENAGHADDTAFQIQLIIDGLALRQAVDYCKAQLTPHADRQLVINEIQQILDSRISAGFGQPVEQKLLMHQEGGFYWMREHQRKEIYDTLEVNQNAFMSLANHAQLVTRAQELGVVPEPLAALHDLIAGYYLNEVFEKSRDVQAFIEYAFHRICSIGKQKCDFDVVEFRSAKLLRLRWLLRSIELELGRLQIVGPVSGILHRLYHTRRFISIWMSIADINGQFYKALFEERSKLDNSILELWKGAGAFSLVEKLYLDSLFGVGTNINECEEKLNAHLVLPDFSQGCNATETAKKISTFGQLVEFTNARAGLSVLPVFPKTAASILTTTADWLKRIGSATDTLRNKLIQFGGPIGSDFFEEVRQLRVRTRLKYVDHRLRLVNPWGTEWDPTDTQRIVTLGLKREPRAVAGQVVEPPIRQDLLDTCSNVDRLIRASHPTRRARRYKCYVLTFRGRVETLCGAFDRAHVLYDRARAALSRTTGAPEGVALGIVYLAEMECHLLQALVLQRTAKKGTTTAVDRRIYFSKAEAQVNRAEIIMADARDSLRRGRRDNQTWFYSIFCAPSFVFCRSIFTKSQDKQIVGIHFAKMPSSTDCERYDPQATT